MTIQHMRIAMKNKPRRSMKKTGPRKLTPKRKAAREINKRVMDRLYGSRVSHEEFPADEEFMRI